MHLSELYSVDCLGHRKSDKPRHTPLEHSWHDGRIYIAPGWGERTQWYLNILADPHVTVQRGWRTWGAVARRAMDDQELRALYLATRGKSPVWKQYLASWGVEDTVEDFLAKKDRLIMLRLDPNNESTPPGLKADLIWVWPIVVAAAAAVWVWR